MSSDEAPAPIETKRQRRERKSAETAARFAGLRPGTQPVEESAGNPHSTRRSTPKTHERYTPKPGMARDRRARSNQP